MPYTPHTFYDIEAMNATIGIKDEDELFSAIPQELRAKSFNLPSGKSEFEVFEEFRQIASQNNTSNICFLGGGYYDHIIPAAVDALSMRSEFYTAYTPYQPEASQGTLQALYEYQSMICELTGMECTNASMYDGGSAMAEAALMAVRITKRKKILIDSGVNPLYIQIVKTYLAYHDLSVEVLPLQSDISSFDEIQKLVDESYAGFIYQNPNFFGSIADYTKLIEALHVKGVLAIASTYPISLGLLKTPAQMGADIVCADGQSLGNPLSFGGPSFGILATKEKYIRNLPGRIVGETLDRNAKRAFVLTLQAREQHIRRDKATSNICSNQNLMALRATIFISLLGKNGFEELAKLNFDKANYLKNELSSFVEIYNTAPTFNEFVITVPMSAGEFIQKLSAKGYFAGLNLSKFYTELDSKVLVSVSEKRTKEQMDNFVQAIKEVLA